MTTTTELAALVRRDPDAIRAEHARRRLGAFSRRMFPGEYVSGRHIRDELWPALEAVERGEVSRLIITMPPRHSKSMNVSEDFPAWYLGRNPTKRMIAVSHTAGLSYTFSRRVRNKFNDSRYPFATRLADDKAAVQSWDTDAGGGYLAVGVGGSPTGHGADLIVIDDPIRSAADADSETVRESLWEWYQGTIRTRLQPGGAIIVTATRWHEDDLTGRLLAESANGGEQWVHIHLSAIDETGAALWPEFWPLEELAKIRAAVGSRAWEAQYQGRPVPAEGGMFKRHWWRRWTTLPRFRRAELYVDSAFKDGVANDYSAFALWGLDDAGLLCLVKAWRKRVEFPALIQLGHKVHAEARQIVPYIHGLPLVVEDKASGQSAIQTWRNREFARAYGLDVLPVVAHPNPGNLSKIARAEGVTGMAEGGRMLVPEAAPWLDDWLTEHESFPTGKHDDWVDTTSMAGTRLGLTHSSGARARSF